VEGSSEWPVPEVITLLRETGRFTAQSDDGRSYGVLILTEGGAPPGDESPDGTVVFMLKDGAAVKRIQKGEYEVAGITIRSSDANAP